MAVRLYSIDTDRNVSRHLDIFRLQLSRHQYVFLPIGVAICVPNLSGGDYRRLYDWSANFRDCFTNDHKRGSVGFGTCRDHRAPFPFISRLKGWLSGRYEYCGLEHIKSDGHWNHSIDSRSLWLKRRCSELTNDGDKFRSVFERCKCRSPEDWRCKFFQKSDRNIKSIRLHCVCTLDSVNRSLFDNVHNARFKILNVL